MQSDPIGFLGEDENLYSYVRNDPVNFIDPSGLIRFPPGLRGGTPRGPYTAPKGNAPRIPPKGPPSKPFKRFEVPSKPGQDFIPPEPWWIRLLKQLLGDPPPEEPGILPPVCPSDPDPTDLRRFGWPVVEPVI